MQVVGFIKRRVIPSIKNIGQLLEGVRINIQIQEFSSHQYHFKHCKSILCNANVSILTGDVTTTYTYDT